MLLPVWPIFPSRPVEPVKPVLPGVPGRPTGPTLPASPGTPGEPLGPTGPGFPVITTKRPLFLHFRISKLFLYGIVLTSFSNFTSCSSSTSFSSLACGTY